MNTTLTIRDLDETIVRKLRTKANTHGRSLEAEIREILISAVAETEGINPTIGIVSNRQAFLDLLGSVEGAPDLGSRCGFEAPRNLVPPV